jgi:hypothetical protein
MDQPEQGSPQSRVGRARRGIPRPNLTGCDLGVYQGEALIGAGAMGEVYRARDTKLVTLRIWIVIVFAAVASIPAGSYAVIESAGQPPARLKVLVIHGP